MSHNINTITLEVNAATELVDRDTFATVFAIHNRYAGTDNAQQPVEKAVPISVLFGAHTLNYARKTVQKGSRFIVTGELDYDAAESPDKGKEEFFTIRAHSLTPFPRADASPRDGVQADTRTAKSQQPIAPARRS